MKDDLADIARRRHERAEKQRKGNEPSFVQSLAYIGVLGWLVMVPTVLGILAGRALDEGQGRFWTARLLVGGLVLGCWLAWRRVRES